MTSVAELTDFYEYGVCAVVRVETFGQLASKRALPPPMPFGATDNHLDQSYLHTSWSLSLITYLAKPSYQLPPLSRGNYRSARTGVGELRERIAHTSVVSAALDDVRVQISTFLTGCRSSSRRPT